MIARTARVLFALSGLLAVMALPASAQYRHHRYYGSDWDGEFRIHVGSFRPDGNSDYWDGIRNDFTNSDPSDFDNANFGLDYILPLNGPISLMFSGSVYEGSSGSAYRNFADNFGGRIRHDTTLDIASVSAGLLFHLAPRSAPVQPYVGAGGGIYPWRLKESGDFIDFNQTSRPIFSADLRSDGTAFGWYGLVGLEVPVSRRLNLFAEGRWTRVDDKLNKDFEGFGKLDLSGREIAAGLSWTL
ncbi:MAG TPA: outer membrane beta-barrel protein [Thermoanaerobaculia bacterium]|jgi:opacity protein-like surface antigen|nr:outer membrane beta-barrel protein [Thermoanaerobaculia bacterium]